VLEATPSPSSGTSRVGTPPVTTTPDVIVASSSTGVPSPAGSDTPSAADTGPSAAKRPRLRSTKSELFMVNSDLSRDTTDTDGSCDGPAQNSVAPTVASLVTTVSDDSFDSSSLADVSQNSVTAVTTGSAAEVVDEHLTGVQSIAVQACKRLICAHLLYCRSRRQFCFTAVV